LWRGPTRRSAGARRPGGRYYRAFDANAYRGRFDVVFDTHGALSPRQCGAMLKRRGVALHLVPTLLKMVWSMRILAHFRTLSFRHNQVLT
jgi:hypothetical protein